MGQITKAKITDLKFDDKNFNKGTDAGGKLIEKSFAKFGAGRSVLIDKNNNIIAGNKSTENFAKTGRENIIIVDADANTLVAVRRNDIDLNTPQGREMALADNATAKANIVFEEALIEEVLGEDVMSEWGVSVENINFDDIEGNQDRDNTKENKEVNCPSCGHNFEV